MWNSSSIKDRILIGKHGLDCGGDQIAARYRDSWSGRYDGVHMYGTNGKDAYTRSVLDIMKAALPTQSLASSSSFHSSCPQTQYQGAQKKKTGNLKNQQQRKNVYTIPVSNQFDILGN